MARKPTKDDSKYIENKLLILRQQMDKAKSYLKEHPWESIEDEDKREKEFRFQKSLTDSLLDWTESYVNISGIMDVYKQLEAAKNKNRTKGNTEISGIQLIVKELAKEQGRKRGKQEEKEGELE